MINAKKEEMKENRFKPPMAKLHRKKSFFQRIFHLNEIVRSMTSTSATTKFHMKKVSNRDFASSNLICKCSSSKGQNSMDELEMKMSKHIGDRIRNASIPDNYSKQDSIFETFKKNRKNLSTIKYSNHHDDQTFISEHCESCEDLASLMSSPVTIDGVEDKNKIVHSKRSVFEFLRAIGFGKEESYSKSVKIGHGTYAVVYKGWSHILQMEVAVKEIKTEHEEGAPCTALREISLLRSLKHSNIVLLHDVVYTKTTFMLVFEFLVCDLKQYISRCYHKLINLSNIRLFLFQILRALQYCHSKKILHRDLKPQNILLSNVGELKLADFGLARETCVPIKTFSDEVVTLWYRPPDVLLGSVSYSSDIDIWGVGCILLEMLNGKCVFAGNNKREQLYLIFRYLGHPNKEDFPEIQLKKELATLKIVEKPSASKGNFPILSQRMNSITESLIQSLLIYNPRNRISASTAMQHPFFTEVFPVKQLIEMKPNASIFNHPDVILQDDYSVNKHSPCNDFRDLPIKKSHVVLELLAQPKDE